MNTKVNKHHVIGIVVLIVLVIFGVSMFQTARAMSEKGCPLGPFEVVGVTLQAIGKGSPERFAQQICIAHKGPQDPYANTTAEGI